MAYGLEVRDSLGNITLDTSSKTGRVIGLVSISYNSSGYFDVTQRVSGEKVFAVLTTSLIEPYNQSLYIANTSGALDENGNRVVYSLQNTSGYIIYGVY